MKAFLLALILLNNAHALEMKKDKVGKLNGTHYMVREVKGVPTLFIGKKEKMGKAIAADSPVQDFLSIGEVSIKKKNYLVTKWLKGVHGETVRILNKNGKELYRFNSSWPVSLKIKKDQLEILGHIGTDAERPEAVTKYWSP